MWHRWVPWRYLIRRLALRHGFLDPIVLLARLHLFSQPSEIAEPLELLRAGALFHARGLVNTRAIQHNLDWIWPFWVERQFDPEDESFIPRAFSVTHVNLTHRNWTALGIPGAMAMPIVDPAGLVTPHWDGWSLDAWILPDVGPMLVPSRSKEVRQSADFSTGLAVRSACATPGARLASRAETIVEEESPRCRIEYDGACDEGGWLVVSLRPCNPEGVSFVHEIGIDDGRREWRIDGRDAVILGEPADRALFSDYRSGDVSARLAGPESERVVRCAVGMATAAALFRLRPGESRRVSADIPLRREERSFPHRRPLALASWPDALAPAATVRIPDAHFQFLFDAAVRSLVLLSPGDVFPGPYTYKRFWFRDAAYMLHALTTLGLEERVAPVLELFRSRQRMDGYFLSQEGEWDSNGEALWAMERFVALTGRRPSAWWRHAIRAAVRWIERKLLPETPASPHAGLLPPGFSAEHLGPNDYYYWDDYWSVAGLRAAARLARQIDPDRAVLHEAAADRVLAAIARSLASVKPAIPSGIPASPYRRLDAGAIGSIVADYPLRLTPPRDPAVMATVDFLLDRCLVKGGFFQDMIHSGINAYLTLQIAQVLLRAGDARFLDLVSSVAKLASPTGQWPEAIHARTLGGCMGDGHHGWAAAEWVLMIRNMFVREEGDELIVGSGIPGAWLRAGEPLSAGIFLTEFGGFRVAMAPAASGVTVEWELRSRGQRPPAVIRLAAPGLEPARLTRDHGTIEVPWETRS